jgi:hypothetical protein
MRNNWKRLGPETNINEVRQLFHIATDLSSPQNIARIIQYELSTLNFPPQIIKYNNHEDQVHIYFNSQEELNLYKITGNQYNGKWHPTITCLVK